MTKTRCPYVLAILIAALCVCCLPLAACKTLRSQDTNGTEAGQGRAQTHGMIHATDADNDGAIRVSRSAKKETPKVNGEQGETEKAEVSEEANTTAMPSAPPTVHPTPDARENIQTATGSATRENKERPAPQSAKPVNSMSDEQKITAQQGGTVIQKKPEPPLPLDSGQVTPPAASPDGKSAVLAASSVEPAIAPAATLPPSDGSVDTVEACELNQALIREPGQRAAFIRLLNKKLNKKKGFYVPLLEDEERESLGPYAEQYDFLRTLAQEDALLQKFTPAEDYEAMLIGDAKNPDNYGKILADSRRTRQLQTQFANFYRNSVNARETLKQPFKVKPVFDEAFNKKVLAPLAQLLKITPYIEEELRHLASASLVYANEPHNPEKSALLKEFLRRYKEVSEDGNSTISEIKGEE